MTPGRSTAIVALAILGALVAALGQLWWLNDGPAAPITVGEETGLEQPAPDAAHGDRAPDAMTAPENGTGNAGHRDDRPIDPIHKRSIRLQFRCQTLEQVEKVWRHMGLRVQLEDDEGVLLAECVEPWLPNTVSIPADVQHITCVARGYRPARVSAPETFRDGLQPTVVSLQPDAVVHLQARNLPSAPGNRFGIWARLATGTDGRGSPLLHGSTYAGGTNAPRGQLAMDIRIPSGVPTLFAIARTRVAPDERAGFVDLVTEVVTLRPDEVRSLTVDTVDFGILEGRVTGLPRGLSHQALSVHTESGSTQASLDGDGGFRIVGLSGPASLWLVTQGGPWPALREVSSGQRTWPPGRFLILEPVEPVYGVVPARDGQVLRLPFQVQPSCPPDGHQLGNKVPLFTRGVIARAPLYFFVEGFGHFNRSLAGEQPDADGLYRVEVSGTGGDLVVRMAEPPGDGMQVFARKVTSNLGFTGMRGEGGWRFEGLAAGEYQLVVHHAGPGSIHSERVHAETAVVRPRQQTTVTIDAPELVEIRGQIRNWEAIPLASRPQRLQVHHGGRPHTTIPDGNGAFQVTVIAPWDGVSKISFFHSHWLTRVETTDIESLSGPRLSVEFPEIRQRRLTVDTIAGGKLSIQVHVGAGGTSHLRPEDGNHFLIAGAPGEIEGVVLEEIHDNGRRLHLLRGWFKLPADGPDDIHLAPTGRWIRMAGGEATITVVPPPWWTHPPQPWASVRLEGAEPRRLWLPDGATAVTVNGTAIPLARIGETLYVDR